LGFGYQVISFGLALQADYSGGLQASQRAVELNPNDPDSMIALAKTEIGIEPQGLPRLTETQIQLGRGGLTAGPLRHF
ncbi:hypothetical protein, partial [Rhizobium johnstonii]|uniref:hypothetical protein n=1 Tax=Rhizobium johnstonii TaxID=3019933 RepID=UPI003F9D5923